MPCDFTVSKAGDSIVLIHLLQALDLGFGLTQGASTVKIKNATGGSLADPTIVTWSAGTIFAILPPNLGPGTYTVTVDVVAPAPPCTKSATFTIVADPVTDLLFAKASPAVAELGATIDIINTKPGFVWQESVYKPVALLTLADVVVNPAPQDIGGWGTNTLKVKLPSSGAYTLQEPVQAHTFRFNNISTRVPIVLKAASLDPITVTTVLPTLVMAGQTFDLLNFMPGFSWNSVQHPVPQLLDQNHQPVPALVTYVTGYGTQALKLQLPPENQFPATGGTFPTYVKFANSSHEIAFVVLRVTLPVDLPHVLTVRKLTCHQTEDWLGADECRLEIRPDLRHPVTGAILKWPVWVPLIPAVSLNNGESHDYDVPTLFWKEVAVRLIDEDWPDPDDNLGEKTVKAGDSEVKFTRDEADYTLTVDVT